MLMSMEDEQVEAVSSCNNAQEVWQKLATMYESTSGENKQLLWQKFYSIMTKDSPVKTMCEIQSIAAQLRSLSVVVEDEAIVARVISSMMDEKYRQFREAWRSVELANQKSTLLLSRLKIWELEDQDQNASSTDCTMGKAFKVGKKKSKEELLELKKKTKCHNCGQKGHWKSECKKQDNETGVTAAYAIGNNRNEWVNDSGATKHHCGKMEWFRSYQKYDSPMHVKISNGSKAEVLGAGTVRVKALIRKNWCVIELLNVQYIPGGANLFSENIMLEKGFDVLKTANEGIIFSENGVQVLSAELKGGIQVMKFKPANEAHETPPTLEKNSEFESESQCKTEQSPCKLSLKNVGIKLNDESVDKRPTALLTKSEIENIQDQQDEMNGQDERQKRTDMTVKKNVVVLKKVLSAFMLMFVWLISGGGQVGELSTSSKLVSFYDLLPAERLETNVIKLYKQEYGKNFLNELENRSSSSSCLPQEKEKGARNSYCRRSSGNPTT
ncbi:unnamed protein product [Orchesella dallaii]|uniref:CCHC-type domain-containing protein n=1 Tax=Orchesella dallaii TaxID=48710 RepID=A0ABP1RQY5_9HEXA